MATQRVCRISRRPQSRAQDGFCGASHSRCTIHSQEKISHGCLLGMQAGQFLGGSVRALRVYRRLGVRYMTMTHAWTNLLCDSSSGEIRWNGLSEVGREVVREMGDLGVIPDISHATDRAAFQVLGEA